MFTLSGLRTDFVASIDTITDVSFQFGTNLNDPNIVPEPGTLLLIGSGLAGLGFCGRRRRRATPSA